MALLRRRRWLDGKSRFFSLERFALPLIKAGLLAVAFFMTWKGVSDFVSVRELTAGPKFFKLGDMTFSVTSVGSAFVVLMLILAMYVALLRLISPIAWPKRVLAGFLYALIVLFSIGFGYGFWWGLFASKDVSNTDARSASDSLRTSTSVIRTRLEGIKTKAEGAAKTSRDKSTVETNKGGTCGDRSAPEKGPRAIFREKKATELEKTASTASANIARITTALTSIDKPLSEYLQKRTAETGKDDLAKLDSTLQISAATINELLRQVGTDLTRDMSAIRSEFMLRPGEKGFVCADESLAKELEAAIKEAEAPLRITVPRLTYKEGADATATAVERLWQSVGAVLQRGWQIATLQIPWNAPLSLPLFSEEAGGGRNIAALVAAGGVDFALLIFVLIAVRPPFDKFAKIVPASPDSLDKFLFLLETFIEKGDEEAIKFWRRCMLRVRDRAFFVAPNPDLAHEDKRPLLEAVEVLASVLSEVNGVVPVSRFRFREAWARGIQRLSSWGWEDPTRRHFDLYLLNDGEFREIATRLEQHKKLPMPEQDPYQIADRQNPSVPTPNSWANRAASIAWAQHLNRIFHGARKGLASLRAPPLPEQPSRAAPPAPRPNDPPPRTLQDILSESLTPGIDYIQPSGPADDIAADNREGIDAKPSDGVDATVSEESDAATAVLDADKQSSIADIAEDGTKAPTIDVADVIENLHELDVAMKAMETLNSPGFIDGLAAMRRKWQTSLQKYEIEPFGAIGEKPDPNTHFIRGSKPSTVPAGEVAEVLRSGYRKHGRVLHPADVIVSEGMPSDRSEADNDVPAS
jgi:hypothetical protein